MTGRLVFADGRSRTIDRPVVIGRDPDRPGYEPVRLPVGSMLASKNHVIIHVLEQVVEVTDIGSTNGTTLILDDGNRVALTANLGTHVTLPCTIDVGEQPVVITASP